MSEQGCALVHHGVGDWAAQTAGRKSKSWQTGRERDKKNKRQVENTFRELVE